MASSLFNKLAMSTKLLFPSLVDFHLIKGDNPLVALLPIFCVIPMNISLQTAVHGAVLCVVAFKIMLFESRWWSLLKQQ